MEKYKPSLEKDEHFDPTSQAPRRFSVSSWRSSTSEVGQYRVGARVGRGNFGEVRIGYNMSNGDLVAIKFETIGSNAPMLRQEYEIYLELGVAVIGDTFGDLTATGHVPQLYEEGFPIVYLFSFVKRFYTLTMELLGPNLSDLLAACGGHFSLRTVCLIAKQLIRRLEFIHSKGFVYRDVKPENFCIGHVDSQRHIIHVIDFGLAKRYYNPHTLEHIVYREGKSTVGTARFISLNMHAGRELSRRDDMESLGYLFVYLARGRVPWQGLRQQITVDNEFNLLRRIQEVKEQTSIEDLCEGLPNEMIAYLSYVRELGFYERPDYDFLNNLFGNILRQNGWPPDYVYDWDYQNVVQSSENGGFLVANSRARRYSTTNTDSAANSRTNYTSRVSLTGLIVAANVGFKRVSEDIYVPLPLTEHTDQPDSGSTNLRCPFCRCRCCVLHRKKRKAAEKNKATKKTIAET